MAAATWVPDGAWRVQDSVSPARFRCLPLLPPLRSDVIPHNPPLVPPRRIARRAQDAHGLGGHHEMTKELLSRDILAEKERS